MISQSIARLYLGTLKSAKTVVYTVPVSNDKTVIKELAFHNTSTTDSVAIKMYLNDTILVDTSIAPKDSMFNDREWFTVMKPGDTLSLETGADNVISMMSSGVETVIIADN